MFEITPEDIYALKDEDLRALVALLCESAVRARGVSPAGVTYGGNQTAKDGGVDVRVTLAKGTQIDGFIPRTHTGFQVKKPDMGPAAIINEMRPKKKLRQVIKDLAAAKGAYVIASSGADVSDSALAKRLAAMRQGVKGAKGAKNLELAFYDRTRLSTWVRDHGGVILWVRQKLGRSVPGWHPYGPWAYAQEDKAADYILDEKLKVRTGNKGDGDGLSAVDGLNRIRSVIAIPGKAARIVGLSGVGKTRFVQALFDNRVGIDPLDPSLAIYANLADDPNPVPVAVVSDLVASATKAVVIVDNCPPELHGRLVHACRASGSAVSVVTVEYDIRDDNPEGTEVFGLEPSSDDLIERLLKGRFPNVSRVDRETIAAFSGGNARIAVALAQTVGKKGSLAGLSDADLFARLFQQRHEHNDELLNSAKACSLVYSFDGEDVTNGAGAELHRLGECVRQDVNTVFKNVAELRRRELVQQRSKWRAVLPHAIANRLAMLALDEIPYSIIESRLIGPGAPARLFRSFSHRLGYLHNSSTAVSIVAGWLSQGGRLADLTTLDELHRTVFDNVLPVAPDQGLEALERASSLATSGQPGHPLASFVRRIRALAWEANKFERCAKLLLQIAKWPGRYGPNNEALNAFESLFPLYLSGTHATIEQRIALADQLLRSSDVKDQEFGERALHVILESWHFSSFYDSEFGAHSRDHGYFPRTDAEIEHWYTKALDFAVAIGNSNSPSAERARSEVAKQYRGLWRVKKLRPKMEDVTLAFNGHQYWREGWIGIRRTLRFDLAKGTPEYGRLSRLEKELRPAGLVQRIRAMLLTGRSFDLDFNDVTDDEGKTPEVGKIAFELGKEVGADRKVFAALVPELVTSQGQLADFGRGLVDEAKAPRLYWDRLVNAYLNTPAVDRSEFVLRGVIQGIATKDRELADNILDDVVENNELAHLAPIMQMMLGLDRRGATRMLKALASGNVPAAYFSYLGIGGSTKATPPAALAKLILGIARIEGGFGVACNIAHMRIFGDRSDKKPVASEIKSVGRELLRLLPLDKNLDGQDFDLANIARNCLEGRAGASVVKVVAKRLREAIKVHKFSGYNHHDLLAELTKAHPAEMLGSLLSGISDEEQQRFLELLRLFNVDVLSYVPEKVLLAWCEENPSERYVAAAAAIAPFDKSHDDIPRGWNPTALKLLNAAPDPEAVLEMFADKIYPRGGWSGSFASALENNMQVLDELVTHKNQKIADIAVREKERFSKWVIAAREKELAESRLQDERFEN